MCVGPKPKAPAMPDPAKLEAEAQARADEKLKQLNDKKRAGRAATLNKTNGSIGITTKALGEKGNSLA